jgi:alpha-beta hydrolase superfamily lysophospholipase
LPQKYTLNAFTSSDETHKIVFYTWTPPHPPYRGVIQIIHGMREHMGRYADFADFCTRQGYIVCGHDQLGHGKTAQKDGNYGFFGSEDGCECLVADCARASKILSKKYAGLPLFLLGHSMGSFLGRLLIVRSPNLYAGFICMGTGGDIPAAPAARAFLEVVARTKGDKQSMHILNQMVVSPTLMRFDGDSGSMAWLSRDKDVVSAFTDDLMTQPLFTNRGLCDLISLQMAATSKKWAGKVAKNMPILLISGERDVIGRFGKGVVQTYERLKLAGCMDVQCILYEKARHEILNELNREEVYYDIYRWLQDHQPG